MEQIIFACVARQQEKLVACEAHGLATTVGSLVKANKIMLSDSSIFKSFPQVLK